MFYENFTHRNFKTLLNKYLDRHNAPDHQYLKTLPIKREVFLFCVSVDHSFKWQKT